MYKLFQNLGFTLLEMMIVVSIIAIISAAIAINIGTESPQKRIDKIGDHFYRHLLLAADTALLSGDTIGLQIEQDQTEDGRTYWHYTWYRYAKASHSKITWKPLSKPLAKTVLPDDVALALFMEGELIEDFDQLSTMVEQGKGDIDTRWSSQDTIKPEIIISQNGEITDFTLELTYRAESAKDGAIYRIGLDETGELAVGSQVDN